MGRFIYLLRFYNYMEDISIKKAQEIVDQFVKEQNWKTDSSEIFNHLIEEIGEVARELRKNEADNNLKRELADVLFLILKLSNKMDINLEESFIEKFESIKKKFE